MGDKMELKAANLKLKESLLDKISNEQNQEQIKKLMWSGSFDNYLDIVKEDPAVVRSSFQRIYDMIISHGTTKNTEMKEKLTSYNFFKDPFGSGEDAIAGLDKPLMELVRVLKSAADCRGPERRM